jgi:hypothetical protein
MEMLVWHPKSRNQKVQQQLLKQLNLKSAKTFLEAFITLYNTLLKIETYSESLFMVMNECEPWKDVRLLNAL